MIITIIGPPGSGKSTQAKKLASKLERPAISVGQLLRDAEAAGTLFGKEAGKYMRLGKLLPSALLQVLTRFRLEQADCKNGFILDGSPRKVGEAVELNDYLKRRNQKINKVFLIEIPREESIKRLLKRKDKPKSKGGGREDDNIEDIKVRLAEYNDNIKGVKNYFREKDILKIIDGTPDIETIHKDISSVLQV